MHVNADFASPMIVAPHQYQWVDSPQGGVERAMLDRLGGEKARATSIVRYATDSSFPRHLHPGGEEILVLSGTFSEEDQDYPAGWYLRNPPGSSHRPFSREGAIIFVKLRQMSPDETGHVRIDTRDPMSWSHQGSRLVCPLFASATEQVCLQRMAPLEAAFSDTIEGAELLVLSGELVFEGQAYTRGAWLRLPSGRYPGIVAGSRGATVYVKTGHLAALAAETP